MLDLQTKICKKNRDDKIRTCDPCDPNTVRYQTALHPDLFNFNANRCRFAECATPLRKTCHRQLFLRQSATSRFNFYIEPSPELLIHCYEILRLSVILSGAKNLITFKPQNDNEKVTNPLERGRF